MRHFSHLNSWFVFAGSRLLLLVVVLLLAATAAGRLLVVGVGAGW